MIKFRDLSAPLKIAAIGGLLINIYILIALTLYIIAFLLFPLR